MNHTSTVAALREIADTLEDRYPGEGGRPAAAMRIRDIATTLERQGGALDLAERLEAAAAAISAAAERLEALTVAPPDLDVAGFGEELTGAVRRILTEDYREIIARGDRPERVAAVARAETPPAGPNPFLRNDGGFNPPPVPVVSRITERHTVHADGSETHEHYVDDGSARAVHFSATSNGVPLEPANATPGTTLGAAALAVPVPPAPSALQAMADSSEPLPGGLVATGITSEPHPSLRVGPVDAGRGSLESLVSRLAVLPGVLDVLAEDYTAERGRVAIMIDGDPDRLALGTAILEALPAHVGTEGTTTRDVPDVFGRYHAIRWSQVSNLRVREPATVRHVKTW